MAEKLGFRSVWFAWLDKKRDELVAGKRAIIKDVSFSVGAGEIFVVAGPSGSGKSTLLRLANGLVVPTSGLISLDGHQISDLEVTELRRRVGLVQQTPALFDGTVMENVMFGPSLLQAERAGRRFCRDDALRCLMLAGLDESFADRDAEALSEGEKQRVAIARVLANDPDVLLLDEPTSSLDPTSTQVIESLVKRLRQTTGLTILFVTHDVEQAKRIGDRGILLVEGRKVDEGPLPKLFAHPSNETTRAFVEGSL